MTIDTQKRPRVTPQEHAAIIARLKVTRNAALVAREMGLVRSTVARIAKKAKIELCGYQITEKYHDNPIYQSLMHVSGNMRLPKLSEHLGLQSRIIYNFIDNPDYHSVKWVKGTLVPRLLMAFPDQESEIKAFEVVSSHPRISVTKIKRDLRKEKNDYKAAAGALLREMRVSSGLSIDDTRRKITTPVVRKTLEKIEAGDAGLAGSIYGIASRELARIFGEIEPDKTPAFIPHLRSIVKHLRR